MKENDDEFMRRMQSEKPRFFGDIDWSDVRRVQAIELRRSMDRIYAPLRRDPEQKT